MKNYGGNIVDVLSFDKQENINFSQSPYFYGLYFLNDRQKFQSPNLEAMTIYVYALDKGASLVEKTTSTHLNEGDAILLHHARVDLEISKNSTAMLLIAGIEKSALSPNKIIVTHRQIKKVTKPWGHELWINGEDPEYAFKQVYIRHPHKTSLQYHNFKQETIVLFSGSAHLHYKKDQSADNDSIRPADLDTIEVIAPTVVQIAPPVLHRFEASTDLVLYEASTPHLHDVIRVSDDSNRPDGKIESEHKNT